MFAFIALLVVGVGAPAFAAGKHDDLVKNFVAAFSAKDFAAVAKLVHDDVQWLNVEGASVKVEARGKTALIEQLKEYFTSCPSCSSEVEISSINGDYVATVETATWKARSGQKTQSSIAIYEISAGKILRVWYYPAVSR
jgi:hypothetical protein